MLGLGAWQGRGVYQHWRARESLRQARSFLREGQQARAALSIQASLSFDSENPEALQLAAEFMESQGNPKAVEFRQRRAALSSAEATALISLAETALRFNQMDVARNALARVLEVDRNHPEYLSAQAACFVMSGRPQEAAAAYQALLAGSPDHELAKAARVNLARLWLGSRDRGENAKANALLEPLAGDPAYGAESLRMRTRQALKEGNSPEAVRLGTHLTEFSKAGLEDRLLLLDALSASHSPLIDAALLALEHAVSGKPDAESDLAAWMLKNQGTAVALKWLTSLPAAEQDRMPIPVVLADCHAALKNWIALENLLAGKNWREMEAQRLGLLARAAWGRGDERSAARAWSEALNDTRQQPISAFILARMATGDGRMAEACAALWRVPATDPNFPEAQNQLFAFYQKQKDAKNLLRLLEQALTIRPDDLDLKRSTAALLLIGGRQIPRAARLAKEAYLADPKPIANAAVYAFSLLLIGDAAGAEQVLEKRPQAERLNDAAVSYYILILSARGRIEEAHRYARQMNRQVLFPEMLARIESAETAWSPLEGR